MDPFEFAAAVAAAVAALFATQPLPQPVSAPVVVEQEVVDRSTYTIQSGEHEETTVIVNPFDLGWDEQAEIDGQVFSIGWIVSPVSGRLVCVTAAPCEQDPQFRGLEDSSWNWVTEEEN